MYKDANIKTDSHSVSLIIPTIDRESLANTKVALESQTRPPDELIVIFDRDLRGQAWGRNQGFQQAKGDLIAFTDDDCIPPADWVERMITALDMHDAEMVFSHYNETDPLLSEVWLRRKLPITTRSNSNEFVGNGGNVIYRRKCLELCQEIDGFIFNPVFRSYGAEDTDLSFRLRQRGHRLVYIDNPITHLKKVTVFKYLLYQFNRGVGIGILYKQHKEKNQDAVPDRSLLWDTNKGHFQIFRWLVMIWKKILGPFDRKSFSRTKYFWTFWVGEKFQAVGFLYALIYKYRKCSTAKAGS